MSNPTTWLLLYLTSGATLGLWQWFRHSPQQRNNHARQAGEHIAPYTTAAIKKEAALRPDRDPVLTVGHNYLRELTVVAAILWPAMVTWQITDRIRRKSWARVPDAEQGPTPHKEEQAPARTRTPTDQDEKT